METNHTPGPWELVTRECPIEPGETYTAIAHIHHREVVGKHSEQDVCHVSTWGRADGESTANARLIAAAPDLLEACRAALSVCEAESANWQAEIIRAAIAKATGEE
jgi:hypothetical protein